jgi:hypothetical protein
MKTFAKLALALVGAIVISQGAQAGVEEREVQVGFSDAFIPSGFDSNSDTFVVASGLFPNGCYRWKESEVRHPATNVHEIRASATVSQGMCLMVLVPFTKEIHLGKLSVGTHAVRLLNGDGTYIEKQLNIEE